MTRSDAVSRILNFINLYLNDIYGTLILGCFQLILI